VSHRAAPFFWDGCTPPLRYAGPVSIPNAQKLLFELRAVLDRIGENDSTLQEAIVHDVDRAKRLADSCISQLTTDDSESGETEEEDDE
jgi:hypothetical protein